MTEQFTNFAQSTLSTSITATQTTISIAPASKIFSLQPSFPASGNFRIVVQTFDASGKTPISAPEIMIVTAVGGNGTTFTVQRGAESTTAIAFASGAQVTHIVTAGVMQNISAGGTVSSVSVNSANGLGGTVANPTTTPVITFNTSITGVLKGNGTAISAAIADTDYQAPITLTTTGTSGPSTFIGDTLNIPQYSGASWSSLTNPTANLSLSMGNYTTSFTFGSATGTNVNPFTFSDTSGNTGTGYLVNIQTASGSALAPLSVGANGLSNLTIGANGVVSLQNASIASGSNGALIISASMPSSVSATTYATSISATMSSNGSSSKQVAFNVMLSAGGAGTGSTSALAFANTSVNTGTGFFSGAQNYGVNGSSSGVTAGNNTGVHGAATGSSTASIGISGLASASGGINFGVAGAASGSSVKNVGGFFTLSSATPSVSGSAALIADNAGTSSPIFVGQSSGSSVFSIDGTGSITTMPAIKVGTDFVLQIGNGYSSTAMVIKDNVNAHPYITFNAASATTVFGNSVSFTPSGGLNFIYADGYGFGFGFRDQNVNSAAWAFGIQALPSGNGYVIGLANNSPAYTFASTVNNLALDGVNGRIGINNLTPSYTLDVAGGDIALGSLGGKVRFKSGSNASIGSGTLAAGTATIANSSVTGTSIILLISTGTSLTNPGALQISSQTAGTGFTVQSSNLMDSSSFKYVIFDIY